MTLYALLTNAHFSPIGVICTLWHIQWNWRMPFFYINIPCMSMLWWCKNNTVLGLSDNDQRLLTPDRSCIVNFFKNGTYLKIESKYIEQTIRWTMNGIKHYNCWMIQCLFNIKLKCNSNNSMLIWCHCGRVG